MSEKSYLKNQIRLVSLNSSDLFTDQEHAIFMEICDLKNEIDKMSKNPDCDQLERKKLITKKKKKTAQLTNVIKKHVGTPRKVRLQSVLTQKKDMPELAGATWKRMKFSKQINEFESEMSRMMGLHHLDYTFDKIIISWKGLDMLHQLVTDGFTFDLLEPDGTVTTKKYRYLTSSAGQLRTDKTSFISEDMWEKIHDRVMCGLTMDRINEKGCNCNKLLAYIALLNSATDVWEDFDIDRVIVIPDWESEVTGEMLSINPDYTTERGIRTVMLNQIDGAGMMLPSVSRKNFMVRSNWIKGLLCVFDFIKFCEVNNVEPVLTDIYGVKHDLIKEDIRILLTKSQFKMAGFYRNWDEYKMYFKKYGCRFGKTQYEEDYLPDKQANYQALQTLVHTTDEEIVQLTAKEHDRIMRLAKNKTAMLQTLKASSASPNAFNRALLMYPELLRDGHARTQLKDIKKRVLYDAKSGALKLENKRVFIVPDLYAACEYYFLNKERPDGLLKNGEIACRPYRTRGKADVLRSPHLFLEHSIRTIVNDPSVYEWFTTDGCYVSCHDLISRILQADWDGDQVNVVVNKLLIDIAERNIEEFNICPLFYDASKAPAEKVDQETLFKGLKRAHEFSNIGEISNMLTRLWNRNKPDIQAAALLTALNNWRIDGAKTGAVNEYSNYPDIAKKINAATGGSKGRMPFFFFSTRNGRAAEKESGKKKKYAKFTNSTMNRICKAFDDIGNINMNWAGIAPFNYQMLMSGPFYEKNEDVVQTFRDLDGMSSAVEIALAEIPPHERSSAGMYEMEAEIIIDVLAEKFGSIEYCFPFITKSLFSGDAWKSRAHKKMYWRVFGEIAIENLEANLKNFHVCSYCGAKVPNWAKQHNCPKNDEGFFVCVDCGKQCQRTGSRQNRCDECQRNHRDEAKRLSASRRRERQKEYDEKCIGYLRSFLTPTLETEHGGRRLSFVKVGQQTKNDQDGE